MSDLLLSWMESGVERTLNPHRLKSIGLNEGQLEMELRYTEEWEEERIVLTGEIAKNVFQQYLRLNHDPETCQECSQDGEYA